MNSTILLPMLLFPIGGVQSTTGGVLARSRPATQCNALREFKHQAVRHPKKAWIAGRFGVSEAQVAKALTRCLRGRPAAEYYTALAAAFTLDNDASFDWHGQTYVVERLGSDESLPPQPPLETDVDQGFTFDDRQFFLRRGEGPSTVTSSVLKRKRLPEGDAPHTSESDAPS
ncbi:hypothetical protein DXG01_016214 [Tephrocybe rancida]|nr:hypothetical protein DXG01_016214 [Tephrocybe rancida]